jgi:tetratricopeptide (TPR) repeat protein
MQHLLVFLILGQTNGWVGQRVITQYGTVLKVGSAVVDDQKRTADLVVSGVDRSRFRVYRVDQANGPWLWLRAERSGVSGWARVENVVPYDRAVEYFTEQIRLRPSSAFFNSRGIVWEEKGEHEIAIGDFNEAIRLDPTDEAAYNNRGIAWLARKEYDKAISDFDEAIRLVPRYTSAYINRGNAWRDKGQYDRALSDYEAAIRLDPTSPEGYNASAWLRATCPDARYRDGKRAYEEASRAFQLAASRSPYVQGTLAAAYAESGDYNAAVRWQEGALSLYANQADREKARARLELYRARQPFREGPETR